MKDNKKKYKPQKKYLLTPLHTHLKWIVFFVALAISLSSILYTHQLIKKIRVRENQQMSIYANSIKFMASENANTNFILILEEIIASNKTIPVILMDENGTPEFYKNIPKADLFLSDTDRNDFLKKQVREMSKQYPPINIILKDEHDKVYGHKYIYYEDSTLLKQLKYYPYIQLLVIALFGSITFLVFNYLRKSEQNKVWVGMAKETAHQLGTPLSALMAWSIHFKNLFPEQKQILSDFEKDIDRLHVIVNRFSDIGYSPKLESLDVVKVIEEVIDYLKKRLSSKIKIAIALDSVTAHHKKINSLLFSWVIENLCKNAADALDGKGNIKINIYTEKKNILVIDIKDNGRGIIKSNIKNIFRPGFTTKSKGWGFGLALSKRIIEEYHQGKIYVKNSEIGKGTVFSICLYVS